MIYLVALAAFALIMTPAAFLVRAMNAYEQTAAPIRARLDAAEAVARYQGPERRANR